MAVLYNSVNVDEKYSSILEPNLFFDRVMQPGITFTSKYQEGPAGGIFVHKLGISAIEPGTPGRDFTDANVADSLIPIVLNNNFQRSRKIYGVQAAAVAFAKGEEELSLAIKECAEGWDKSGLACVVQEGTSPVATATATDPKAEIIAARKTLKKAKANPNVVICSPDFYALILEKAGSSFTPIANEQTLLTANVGTWLGMRFIEANSLGGSLKYYDNTGTLKTVNTSKVDYVMYDYEALSIIPNFELARLIDSENFAGSKAQVEMNVGYKVTNADCVLVRKHT